MHVMPHIKTGLLATRSGTIMAGALSFQVEWTACRRQHHTHNDSQSVGLSALSPLVEWSFRLSHPRCATYHVLYFSSPCLSVMSVPSVPPDLYPGQGWPCGPASPKRGPDRSRGWPHLRIAGRFHAR